MTTNGKQSFLDIDVGKAFAGFTFPGLDVESLVAAQRKNIEAFTQANQLAVEGAQAVARRQVVDRSPDGSRDQHVARSVVRKLVRHAAQKALMRCEEVHATNAVFMRPERLIIAAIIVGLILLLLQAPWSALALALLVAGVLGYRWYMGLEATERARAPRSA